MDDFAVANRDYFNQHARDFDNRSQSIELTRRTASAIRRLYPDLLNEDEIELMDFACGSGHLARELCPDVKSILGVDVSQEMVNIFKERVANQGLTEDDMDAVCVHLRGEQGELNGRAFDVITCASSYHHFASIDDVTRILAHFLKPGGLLVVVDLLKTQDEGGSADSEDPFPDHHSPPSAAASTSELGSSEVPGPIVAHRGGFRREDIELAFQGAALQDFRMDIGMRLKKKGRYVELFVATGRRM